MLELLMQYVMTSILNIPHINQQIEWGFNKQGFHAVRCKINYTNVAAYCY